MTKIMSIYILLFELICSCLNFSAWFKKYIFCLIKPKFCCKLTKWPFKLQHLFCGALYNQWKCKKTRSSIVSILLVQNLSPLLWRRFIRLRCDIRQLKWLARDKHCSLFWIASDKGSSLLWLFTLYCVGRACQEQTLKLITNIHIRLDCLGHLH
jgi:hypothetical protein